MAIFFAVMALTAITLVLERKDGVVERTLVVGVKTFEFIVSQFSTQSLVSIITLLQGLFGMALGLVVSQFSEN